MKMGNVITAVALPTNHDSAVLAFITNATYFEHCGALLPVIFMKNLQATMVDMRPPRLRQSQHYPFPEVEPSGLNCLFQSSTSSQNHIFTSSLPSAWGKELQLPFLPNRTNRVAMWWSVAQLTNRVTTSPTALSAQIPSRAVPSSQKEYRLWL
ncbi:hypothetical protein EV421DRAFT_810012 [Armillaria borealis]|uniref:Uncharacterized protein n=1 Tax=Armillaria borealis TaxID=47425 RepID=A0AA39JCA8_9AGAR|nr:hypothetical protein EV421DRAFT_810012 [Armillaria borealis]